MDNQIPQKRVWKMERKEAVQNLALVVAMIAIIVGGSFFISIDELSKLVERSVWWGPIILILLKASTIVFAPVSGSPLYPLAGAVFGPLYGFFYIMLGDMLGGSVAFLISRIYGRRVVETLLSKNNLAFLDTALSYIESIKGFVIARIVFVPLPEITSYAAGLTRFKFIPFFIIHSVIGIVPASILVWFGASLSFAKSPFGLLVVLIAGAAAAGLGIFIFFKYIQPKLLKTATVIESKIE